MSRTSLVVALCVMPLCAKAQTAPTKDKEAVVYNEIERGFFAGVQGGSFFLVNPPAAGGTPRPFSPGQAAMVELGYQIGERISVAAFVLGSSNAASSTYVGFSQNRASGDFSSLIPGANVRFAFLGFNDAQEVKRTWLYVRGGAGFALFSPKTLNLPSDVFVFAGPGVEYYTRLRHFSIGLEVTGSILVGTQSLGFAITPNLRYAF